MQGTNILRPCDRLPSLRGLSEARPKPGYLLKHATYQLDHAKGASVLWLELSLGNDPEELFHRALEHNISITPDALFFPSNKFQRCIRVSYRVPWRDQVEQAVLKLASLCSV